MSKSINYTFSIVFLLFFTIPNHVKSQEWDPDNAIKCMQHFLNKRFQYKTNYIVVYKPYDFNFDSLKVLKAYSEAGLKNDEEYSIIDFYNYLHKLTFPEYVSIMSENRAISELKQLVRVGRRKYHIKEETEKGETLIYLSNIIYIKTSNLYLFRFHSYKSGTHAFQGTFIFKYINSEWKQVDIIDARQS